MTKLQNQYNPDYVSPPGATLLDILDERGMSQAELAIQMGQSLETIRKIATGEAIITLEIAQQFEHVFKTPARFWLNREQHYRDYLARRAEMASVVQHR